MKKIYGIYGAGGFASEVMPILKAYLSDIKDNTSRLVYVSESSDELAIKRINNYDIISLDDFININSSKKYLTLAIANNKLREDLNIRLNNKEFEYFTIKALNSTILDNVIIGDGSIICPYVTLTSNINIGKHFQANIYSYVAHDCQVGDFVTFAPAVKCNGNVIIENNVYIGTGAIIKQGKKDKPLIIGKNSIVAPGSFVTKNVPPNTTVIGNPANPLKKSNLKASYE